MSWSSDRGVLVHLVRAGLSLLVFAGVVVLGQVPLGEPHDEAFLRLALRTTDASVEICRDRTPAELEALPAHMRQPRLCERHTLPYRLRVEVDGEAVLDRVLEPGGARSDRPLVFDERVALAPGPARLAVSFAPAGTAEAAGEPLAAAYAAAPRHELLRSISPRAGRIVLVRLDGDGGSLVIDG